MRNIFSARFLILVASVSSLLRGITQLHASKVMTVIQPPAAMGETQIKLGYSHDLSLPEFNLKKQKYNLHENFI
jgi:hypothetical protein